MCLILFAYRCLPETPLVLGANRDEYYSRPTAAADFWEDHPDILAGRDLVAGGTWLGISQTGRFAALTNFRDPAELKDFGVSRGALTRDFLFSSESPVSYLQKLSEQTLPIKGFNLLVGNTEGLYYYSNRQGTIRCLSPGLYGLSNALLDTPWPKVDSGKAAMAPLLAGAESPCPIEIMRVLADRTIPPDETLPNTGVGRDWERILSPRFIVSPTYGTRSSTVLIAETSGRVRFTERTFQQGSAVIPDRNFDFAVDSPLR